jgi:hypothetical protein
MTNKQGKSRLRFIVEPTKAKDKIQGYEASKIWLDECTQKTYSGTVEKNGASYVITYLLTNTEYTSFISLGLIPANTSEVLGHVVVPDDFVEAVATMGMSERERIEKAGGATQ